MHQCCIQHRLVVQWLMVATTVRYTLYWIKPRQQNHSHVHTIQIKVIYSHKATQALVNNTVHCTVTKSKKICENFKLLTQIFVVCLLRYRENIRVGVTQRSIYSEQFNQNIIQTNPAHNYRQLQKQEMTLYSLSQQGQYEQCSFVPTSKTIVQNSTATCTVNQIICEGLSFPAQPMPALLLIQSLTEDACLLNVFWWYKLQYIRVDIMKIKIYRIVGKCDGESKFGSMVVRLKPNITSPND